MVGVTARALRHYGRLGLLKPRRHTASGYRLYSLEDLERVEQIVALKSLGVRLEDIRRVLKDASSLPDELDRQESALLEKRRLIDRAIAAIRELRTAAQHGEPTTTLLGRLTQVMNMQNDSNWMLQYYSPEAQAKLAERAKSFTLEMQSEISREWKNYYREVAALQHESDSGGEKAAALEAKRKQLIEAFTGNDPDVAAGLSALYRDRINWPVEWKACIEEYEKP